MNISIVNIGDELLIGQVLNSNARDMSRLLVSEGMSVREVVTIGDRGEAIEDTLRRLLQSDDAVIVTGGLGPTRDDITKTILCRFFESDLVENAEALENVRRIFDKRGFELTSTNRQQAWVPRCCTVLQNPVGTAPGMWFERQREGREAQVVVALPGVPFEMKHLMTTEVVPRLRKHFATECIVTKNYLVQGIGESFLSDLLEPWETALPAHFGLAYLPQAGVVKLRLTCRGDSRDALQEQLRRVEEGLTTLAGDYIVGQQFESLPELVAERFTSCGRTLAVAESCTGGRLAEQLTSLPGCSRYFRGGVVCYSNESKQSLLGVQADTLARFGAVSEPTVREMVEGVRRRLGADYAAATTGIAGPDGGTTQKPVGTVWVAVASPHEVTARCLRLGTDRLQVIERACNEVFASLVRRIGKEEAHA